jgi:glycosyltransferase involved in cell wall biosynthesis
MHRLIRGVESVLAHVAVAVLLTCTALFVHVARLFRRLFHRDRRRRDVGCLRVLVVGTFYNENWFRSHIMPLSAARGLARIDVITDRPLFDVDKVRYVCPPRWCWTCFGRTLPRGALVFWTALRHRPDLLMGYHIMPNAVLCLLAARLFGGRALYQMTGGPIQIVGGGVGSENALLSRLRRHSPVLEKLLYHVVRLFDVVVVRGRRAADFVEANALARQVLIVSGSVDADRFRPHERAKEYDLVLVARHIKEKQPHLLLDIVAHLRHTHPDVRAALVGDGPLTAELEAQARRLGIEQNVCFLGKLERVEQVLASSKLFVLTSATEGLAIAMVEAMAAGLPVLAPDVGELSELLRDQENGIVIQPEKIEASAAQVSGLLDDQERLARMSAAARERAVARNGIAAVERRWDDYLDGVFGPKRPDSGVLKVERAEDSTPARSAVQPDGSP